MTSTIGAGLNRMPERTIEAVAVYLCKEACPYDPYGRISYCNEGPRWKGFRDEAVELLASDKFSTVTAALQLAASVVPDWLPIDDAPKTGLLIEVKDDYREAKVYWDFVVAQPNSFTKKVWKTGPKSSIAWKPTHWRPLSNYTAHHLVEKKGELYG